MSWLQDRFSLNTLGIKEPLGQTSHRMRPENPTEWTKKNLRNSMRSRLRETPDELLQTWSGEVVAELQSRQDLWSKQGAVALFGGLRSEPDLISTLLPWLQAQGWKTALFTVSNTELLPVIVQNDSDLKRGHLGVWEPLGNDNLPLRELDVILVPGLAFDASTGARMGRGGGFYDRLLSQPEIRAKLVGVTFQLQVISDIPTEPHDIHLPEIVTEKGTQRVVPIAGINA
jgi:5-formyltetrahydrofolate cyclo-ligase